MTLVLPISEVKTVKDYREFSSTIFTKSHKKKKVKPVNVKN